MLLLVRVLIGLTKRHLCQIVVIVKITTDVMEINMGSSTIFTCVDMTIIIKSLISEKMKGVEVFSKGGGG